MAQHFAEPRRVAHEGSRHIGHRLYRNRQPLGFGRVQMLAEGGLRQGLKGEGRRAQHHLSPVELGQVDHVVDDAEEGSASLAYTLHLIGLGRVKRTLAQKVGEAQDAV